MEVQLVWGFEYENYWWDPFWNGSTQCYSVDFGAGSTRENCGFTHFVQLGNTQKQLHIFVDWKREEQEDWRRKGENMRYRELVLLVCTKLGET